MLKNEQPIIFTTPEFAQQWSDLAEQTGAEFGNQNMRYERFPDGTPDVNISSLKYVVQGRIVYWLGDFSSDAEFVRQYSTLGGMARNGAQSLEILCPYFAYGTMERKVDEGDIVTAKAVMRLFGSIPHCRTSSNRISIFDIHDPREEFYSDDRLFINTFSWMAERAKELPEDAIIVFPDLGAKKRFGYLFWKRQKVVFEKIRNPQNPTAEEKELKIIEGKEFVKGGNLYLIDDLVMTGGTLKWAARILRDAGANKISSLFTHPVFPGDRFDSFLEEFDEVTTSDTVPLQADKLMDFSKVTIHSIVPILAQSITS